MKRALVLTCTLVVAVAALALQVPKDIVIGAAAKKQAPVPFSHEKHAKLAKSCDTCHHTQKGMTTSIAPADVKKCSTCHLDPKDKAPSMREMSLTKNPFHKKCTACHKEQKKGPTACTGCHIKKK